jgi:hypothetical protein
MPNRAQKFQDMSDHDLLVVLATEQVGIKERLHEIICPSPQCFSHNERIGRLEDHEKIVVGLFAFLIPTVISIIVLIEGWI